MTAPSRRPNPLARALRPLRHLIPSRWRWATKIWVRDRQHSRPGLNRALRWFIRAAAPPTPEVDESHLPPTQPEDWRDNPHCESPLVSVVIPCHNYGRFLMDALRSVWAQTFQDFEIIIVDDGSTDSETHRVLDALDDPRTRVIRQENSGQAVTRNRGIADARGRYVCCLDADDMIRPTHLEKLLTALETRQCDVAHADLERLGDGEGVARFGAFDLATLLDHCSVNTAALFRRDTWARTGGYSDAMREGYCDWNFWIDLAAAGCRGVHLPEPLHLWRRHGRSITSASTRRASHLTARIRELHADLIQNPDQVRAITASHRRTLAREPFTNLTSNLFAPRSGQRCLLILPTLPPDLATISAPDSRVEVLILITDREGGAVDSLPNPDLSLYHLHPMVPEQFEMLFPTHLCRAHRIENVITVGSALSAEAVTQLEQCQPSVALHRASPDTWANTLRQVTDQIAGATA